MKYIVFNCFLMLILASCNNTPKQEAIIEAPETQANVTYEEKAPALLQLGCYEYKADGNEVTMEITSIDDNIVEGNLSFAYAEKDKNTGTFKGTLNDDKVIGKYTFMSEGVQSIRDVAFKVEKDRLIEGFGDLDASGTTFVDTSSIEYNSTMPWIKTNCR